MDLPNESPPHRLQYEKKKSPPKTPSKKSSETPIGKSLSIPQKILDNKFGFLSGGGGPGERTRIKDFGALWARPHPGPFLWDSMQKGSGFKISFSETDTLVEEYQSEGMGILATLWPFADWDQVERSDAAGG